MTRPWPAGAATGVGSLPGSDIDEACRLVFGELPDLPHLPELPARGVGADLIGRGTALLADLHVDLQPAGWRLLPRAGADERRTRSLLARDLDALEEHAAAYVGPLKLQAAGPWTLAATVELPRGGKALGDEGATHDVVEALGEGLAAHVAEVARRLPAAAVLLQLDEPALPVVLGGQVPTASGFGALRAVEPLAVRDGLRQVIARVGVPVLVHCCAADPPVSLLASTGAAGLSFDMTLLGAAYDEPLAEAFEAGVGLLAGVVPSTDGVLSQPARSVESVTTWAHRMGIPAERLPEIALTPTCGLAGASPAYARAAMAACRAAALVLGEGGS